MKKEVGIQCSRTGRRDDSSVLLAEACASRRFDRVRKFEIRREVAADLVAYLKRDFGEANDGENLLGGGTVNLAFC